MSLYKTLITLILFIISAVFFCALNTVFQLYTPFHSVLSFSILLILLLFFQDNARRLLQKLIAKKYFRRVTDSLNTLETLNSELNRAIRYKEVTRILFKSFHALFKDLPFAFYILEDGKFSLQEIQQVNDPELIAFDINLNDVSDILPGTEKVSIKSTALPKNIQKKMANAGLTSLVPMQGRVHLFTFLLIDYKSIPFLTDSASRKMFHKIQNKAGIVLENSALFVDLEQQNVQKKNLIQISNQILSSFEIKEILDFVLNALKSVSAYNAAAIYLLDKSGKRLLSTSCDGYKVDIVEQLHLKVGQGSCGRVAQTKEIEILDDVRESDHYFPLRKETLSQVSIPLIYSNDILGVLCLESNRISFFSKSLVENLKLFAQLSAIAIFNAMQVDSLIAKRALESDLINAGIVQAKLLVQHFPSLEHLKIIAVNIPSKLVSGDLYDIIRYDPATIGIAIGDVSGKGAPASLMMALILAGLRSQKKSFLTACDTVYRLNNLLAETTVEGRYATFFYAIFALEQKKIIYTNGGHNPPLLIKSDGSIQKLDQGGIVLGYIPDWEFKQEEVAWEPGDLFVAYTDGVTEAMNKTQEEFGEERLTTVILEHRHQSIFEIKDRIITKIKEFSGMDSPEDDLTLVICKNE